MLWQDVFVFLRHVLVVRCGLSLVFHKNAPVKKVSKMPLLSLETFTQILVNESLLLFF